MKPISMFDPNSDRVFSGGSWLNSMQIARVAYRGRRPPSTRDCHLGFRLAWSVR